jgi:hypothetical protein
MTIINEVRMNAKRLEKMLRKDILAQHTMIKKQGGLSSLPSPQGEREAAPLLYSERGWG